MARVVFLSRASGKGFLFSVEAIFALLACGLLVMFVSTQRPQNQLDALYEYQLLNDFLAVMDAGGISTGYVAATGFCLKVEENSRVSLFGGCEAVEGDVVSARRVFVREDGFVSVRAELWKKK